NCAGDCVRHQVVAGINNPEEPQSSSGFFVSRTKVGRESRVVFYSKVELRTQFDQTAAHDLDCIPQLIVLKTVARLLVENGIVVENVIDIEVRLQLPRLAEPENPAKTEIELFDPLPVEGVVRDQVDRCGLRTGGRSLARASREMPAQRLADFSIADHVTRSYG